MSRSSLRVLCVLLAVGVAASCQSHETTAPLGANELSRDQTSDATVHTVVALSRRTYLASDVSASVTIGPEGGEIKIPEAGGRIIVPAGAVSKSWHITMTAKAGWDVAYTFMPHGIVFAVPVTFEQDLDYTAATGMKDVRTLQAGYFGQGLDSIFADAQKSLARVSEVRAVGVDSASDPHVGRFFIYHFSGYIMSSGFAPTDGGGGDSTSPQF